LVKSPGWIELPDALGDAVRGPAWVACDLRSCRERFGGLQRLFDEISTAVRVTAHTDDTRERYSYMKTIVDLPIALTASSRASMEFQLNEAVAVAEAKALREGCRGILVTQHDGNSFTVDLSHDVPFGLTREHRAW
jgi:hypothetical protein